jgi:hypothetical protein
LIRRFSLHDSEDFLDDVTYEAGAIFVRNCPPGNAFVKAWLDLMESDYANIDDSVSPDGEANDFREHRHDQACFNILAHLHSLPFISSREFWYPEAETGRPDWGAHPQLPLQARRIRKPKPLRRRMKKSYERIGGALRLRAATLLKRH